MEEVKGSLTNAVSRIMQCTTLKSMNYREWLKHLNLLKSLYLFRVEGVDYIALAHAMLSIEVVCDTPLEEKMYEANINSLQTFALALEDIQEFLIQNSYNKNIPAVRSVLL